MISLYKANLRRLFKNIIFNAGLVIAAIVTFVYTEKRVTTIFLENKTPDDIMIFLSVAMIFFFAIFVPIYLGAEYADGTFRNKVIVGHTQREVYISNLLAIITGVMVMIIVWFVSGILAGAPLSKELFIYIVVEIFALAGWVAFLTLISLRCDKMITSVVISMAACFISFNWITFGNLFMMNAKGTRLLIGEIIYNIPAMGQWYASSCFYAQSMNPNLFIKVAISLCVIVTTLVIGITGINKRDVN